MQVTPMRAAAPWRSQAGPASDFELGQKHLQRHSCREKPVGVSQRQKQRPGGRASNGGIRVADGRAPSVVDPERAAETTTGTSVTRSSAWNLAATVLPQAYLVAVSIAAARVLGPPTSADRASLPSWSSRS